jgi:hypothetical protein
MRYGTIPGTRTPSRRKGFSLDMSAGALRRLDDLQRATDAASRAEVVRNALKLYAYIVEQRAAGCEVSLLRRKGQDEVRLSLLGVGV